MTHLSIALLDTISGQYSVIYESIPNYEQAELLAQLAISQKNNINKLVVVLPGWSRKIDEDEMQYALKLADKYKAQ